MQHTQHTTHTGLSLSCYNEELMDLMARLVVAPMATKYLFWKKVQSVTQLKQRCVRFLCSSRGVFLLTYFSKITHALLHSFMDSHIHV